MSIRRFRIQFMVSLCLAVLIFQFGCVGERTGKASKAVNSDPLKKMVDQNGPVKAEPGVGKYQGKGYGDAAPLLKPASVYWKAKEKLIFSLVTHAKNQYEALHDRKLKSHQEFMDEIVTASRIKLPKLADGLEYFYDAKAGELMVRSASESK